MYQKNALPYTEYWAKTKILGCVVHNLSFIKSLTVTEDYVYTGINCHRLAVTGSGRKLIYSL